MILRSIKLTNFRGVESLVTRDLPREGVARVALPRGSDPAVLSDALRFVFTGETPETGIFSKGAGFAFVEVGFKLGADDGASLFRGEDSRGNVQVSLREEGGRRVTGGDDSVRSRLSELLGGDPAEQLSGAWLASGDLDPDALALLAARPDDTEAFTEPEKLIPLPDFTQETGVAVAGPLLELRTSALAAAQELRGALRAERLGALARERHAALLAAGARLRRERADAARAADARSAERDRVRTRRSRVREYRDQVAAETARDADDSPIVRAASRQEVSFAAPWALTTLASGLFLVLVMVSTGREGPSASEGVQTGIGIAFLIAVACSVSVTARRLTAEQRADEPFTPVSDRGASPRDPQAWRASLQSRFQDLGDPDDPELLPGLDARAKELDKELAPLHQSLETIDDALAAFDVEAGRAARALHLPMPDRATADVGLADEETVDQVRASVRELGDAVYQATVEREALLAGGAPAVSAAAASAGTALAELGELAKDPEGAKHPGLERWRDGDATGPVSPTDEAADDAEIASLEDTIERLAVAAAAKSAGVAVPKAPITGVTKAATTTQSGVLDTSGAISEATEGAFDAVYRGSDGGLRARATHGRGGENWDALEPHVRSRIAVALAVLARAATKGDTGGAPGVVVLPRSLDEIADDTLLAAVRAGRAGVTQVIAPDTGTEPPPAAERATAPPTEQEAVAAAPEPAADEKPSSEKPPSEKPTPAKPKPAKSTSKKATSKKGTRKSTKRKRKGGGKSRRKK